MDYLESLPEGCPPEDAYSPNDQTFFRLSFNSPPQEKDFFSWRNLNPERNLPPQITECRALSVSVYNKAVECEQLTKLPKFKSRDSFVYSISLVREDGAIKQTGRNVNHYSWWISRDFDRSKCQLYQGEGSETNQE